MNLEIITPDTTIYEGEAELVQLPGIDGSFEILNNHAPLISALAKGKIKLPVSNLAKLKTVLQMVSIGLLLSGDTGNKIINFQDYNAQTIGIIILWLSAFLTLFTAYDYLRKGIDHAISEDNK